MPPVQQDSSGKKPQRRHRPNYAHIHRNPLPLEVFPLTVLHPTNPFSLLQLIWTYLWQWAQPPSSQPTQKYIGHLSVESRSVHITDPKHVRALWEQGFFGKGTLSRSEPTWIDRERARIAARNQGAMTAEEATKVRREERRMFKLERARLERERIEAQRKIEQGPPSNELTADIDDKIAASSADELLKDIQVQPLDAEPNAPPTSAHQGAAKEKASIEPSAGDKEAEESIDDLRIVKEQEHLQLTLEEAYFLSYGLGVLSITPSHAQDLSLDNTMLFDTFRQLSKFNDSSQPAMDDQFILNYVVYHHFRSLGWVVRPGVKFSVDYLLYNRGPVFSHAEFAILIMPSYSDKFWHTPKGEALRKMNERKDWWWLHCVNRVQSQVKKTLVLCYVDIPPPQVGSLQEHGVAAFLGKYRVREFIIRRWLMNRSRD